jgi:hypothetical protein
MPYLIAIIVLLGLVSVGAAEETGPRPALDLTAQAITTPGRPAAGEPLYVSARGLITDELAPGMFLNPTSGTLRRFQFDLEYCALIFHVPVTDSGGLTQDQTAVGHGLIAGFGVTDWFEVGAAGLLVDFPGDDDNPTVGGPMARVRLLRDEDLLPELAVGGVALFGDDPLEKYTAYVAASKAFWRSDTGFLRVARAHVGFRQAWIPDGRDGSFGYIGAEVGLPRHVFLVAEVSNKSGGVDKVPWAAGVQVRHPDGFGFTLAAVQTGNLDELAVYVGVGINFQ